MIVHSLPSSDHIIDELSNSYYGYIVDFVAFFIQNFIAILDMSPPVSVSVIAGLHKLDRYIIIKILIELSINLT